MRSRSRRVVRKSIYDPVHGPIALEGVPLALVSTPGFQRLWGIRQTGFAHLVFPGANHTRLEHSLGAYSVARRMAEAIDRPAAEAETIGVAALLHDIGHGPFSHTLDGPMEEVLGFGHEHISRLVIRGEGDRPGTNPIPALLEEGGLAPKVVAGLVDPLTDRERGSLARALLHGPVDADRIDYLQRDAHYTGVAHGAIDAARLLDTIESERGRVVFADKGRSALEGFLVGRSLMYRAVYYHKTVRAAEVMLQAAVERLPGYPERARPLFGLSDGELLAGLKVAGGREAETVESLLERRLFKRVGGIVDAGPALAARLRKLVRFPSQRRATEEALASRIGAPDGTVLLDLAGLAARSDGRELAEIIVREPQGWTRPFRGPPWEPLLIRPATPFAVALYTESRYRRAAESRLLPRLSDWL
ncbi:MAG: HD domain-containing protein [Thermoplasmata archaeon]|nr:HD domain-containing protein [Thermoplasmata archaeon]MCI4338323.1 HD domain-containing protein [Thermoplasmata archaeon]MCI4341840.1 HD domain-containing protein [Thermoplasmata archaeon]